MTIGNGFKVIDAREFVGQVGRPYPYRNPARVKRLSVHHSVGLSPIGAEAVKAELLRIADFHVNSRGFDGYAYHATVDAEGRPWLTGAIDTSRSTVGNDNPNNLAICILGNFTYQPPTEAAITTARRLVEEFRFELNNPGVEAMGHRYTPGTSGTACPGDTHPNWLSRITGEPVAPVEETAIRVWSRDEIIAAIVAAADERGVPRRLLLGAAIAESGLDQFAERYGYHSNEGIGYAAEGDLAGLQRVLDEMRSDGTPLDCSFGIGQQICAYAPVGDRSMTPENVLVCRDWLFRPENAIPLMSDKLAANFNDPVNPGASEEERILMALFKYNTGGFYKPDGPFAGNDENYRRALAQADEILELR